MAIAAARHLTLLDAATEAHDGALFKVVGDAEQAVGAARDAIRDELARSSAEQRTHA